MMNKVFLYSYFWLRCAQRSQRLAPLSSPRLLAEPQWPRTLSSLNHLSVLRSGLQPINGDRRSHLRPYGLALSGR